jgi:hydroxymethylglutaryl-CoA lyase
MKIKIVEVGPRDGLQNEKQLVPSQQKVKFIEKLIASGCQNIEATSFVSPKWVPQMADHTKILDMLPANHTNYISLVPNQKGLDTAIKSGAKSIAVFAAASDTFSKKNINLSINNSLAQFKAVIEQAKNHGLWVRGYVSCVLGCPYEGEIKLAEVRRVADSLYEYGCDEISLGDTIGIGTANKAVELIKFTQKNIPLGKLAVHFHDTYGQALANIYACINEGIRIIDSSCAGLGGCPYAIGASGNVATEEVVYMLEGMGYDTGINLEKIIEAGNYITKFLNISSRSKVALAYKK